MKSIVIGLSLAVASAAAFGQEATPVEDNVVSTKTPAQAKAELAEAIRTGDIYHPSISKKLNELYPNQYPAKPAAPDKTRAEVKAELAEAIRIGDIDHPSISKKLNELYPNQYPAKPVVHAKTRAQAKAELEDAIRSGEIVDSLSRKLKDVYPHRYPMTSGS